MRSMLTDDETSLAVPALAHTLTKIIALVCVEWGARLAFATDLVTCRRSWRSSQPTLLVAVPRVFEKVFNKAEHKAAAEGHGAVFDKAEEVAIRWSENHTAGPPPAGHRRRARPVRAGRLPEAPGRVRRAAALRVERRRPLGERLTHFFNGIGVRIFEGYGLTETSPTLTLNRADAWKPGTVGRPLAGTTIRIADDGEILAKGPAGVRGLLEGRGGHRRGPSTPTGGSTPATSASSTPRATCGSPGARRS